MLLNESVGECDSIAVEEYPSRAVIDLGAIEHNAAVLRQDGPTCQHMAIVKADAYGHGLAQVTLAAARVGFTWFGAAQLAEARRVRAVLDRAGYSRDDVHILTWLGPSDTTWRGAIDDDIDVSVSVVSTLARLAASAREAGKTARVHVKIDTGMSRAGATLSTLPALASALAMSVQDQTVDVVAAWTHLARADADSPEGLSATATQLDRFDAGLEILADAGIHPRIRHVGATSAILWHERACFDMVRDGIGLYGLSPNPAQRTARDLHFRPAMRLEANLEMIKIVEGDQAISYGGTWTTPGPRWLGLVPIGYGDGVPRAASNAGPVSVITPTGTIRTHAVGRICMDQFMIDLGPVSDAENAQPGEQGPDLGQYHEPPAPVGSRVILFGNPDDPDTPDVPLADEWAQVADTINYEIVTRIGPRVPRVYIPATARP